jgi:methylenetetrahydrofolate dehydrogenase (NADP+)/methenyltetrahydrofolate cyclohydrolase
MTEARLIDGKAFAERLRARVADAVARLKQVHGITPGLAVVLVGQDPASRVYVRNKAKQTEACGMASFKHELPAETDEAALLALLRRLNADPAVDGILVQLPLPKPLDSGTIVGAIDPAKDVDGLHVVNMGRLAKNLPGLVPCTPQGCLLLLKDALGSLAGKHAVVIGRSDIVGKPVALLLLRENCTVTIAHSKTADLAAEVARADIVVAAVGVPRMVKGAWLKPGAVVIDVGINRMAEGDTTKLVGDVDFETAVQRASAITPVPGGVGPMTIACLLANTVTAACMARGLPPPAFDSPDDVRPC